MIQFQAYNVNLNINGSTERKIIQRTFNDLPEGDLLIKVHYSSLNYKDALSASGNQGITSKYPHVPGIDAAGTIIESNSADFKPGDSVIVTGYDLGMNTDGGFQQYIRVPATWAVPLPPGLTLFEAMCYGTAGLTAAQSVWKLSSVIAPDAGAVIVSGASGGVGSFSVAILSKLGYEVIATSGKKEAADFLKRLGAAQIEERSKWESPTTQPLLKSVLAGVIDTVGGTQLINMIKSIKTHGAVTVCGMVASSDLHVSLFPFILRGITMFGISSQNLRAQERITLWNLIANQYSVPELSQMVTVIKLNQLEEYIEKILQGGIKGRIVIDLW